MNDPASTSVVIDIDEVQNFLDKNHQHYRWNQCSTISKVETLIPTFKIEHRISELLEDYYSPAVVSIGPYHHGKHGLQFMEKRKWNYLHFLLQANQEKTLNDYLKALQELYPVARTCYKDDIKMENRKFIEVLLLDACFIIVSICGMDWSSDDNPISFQQDQNKLMDPLDYTLASRDVLLLENQIPFVVVKTIYELFMGKEDVNESISDKLAMFIEQFLLNNPLSISEQNRPRDYCHLLHLFHMYLRPTQNSNLGSMHSSINCHQPNLWHRGYQYHTTGVKFEKREFDKRNPHSLLDVKFDDGVLQIPYFVIHEGTLITFKNLIALEKTNTQFGNDIMAYIVFMSQLVGDVKDVSLLVSTGIIGHQFASNEEVLNILCEVSESVVFHFDQDYYLKTIHQSLESFYDSRMNLLGGWLHQFKATSGWV